MKKVCDINLCGTDQIEWARIVSQWKTIPIERSVPISITFPDIVDPRQIEPCHYVMFACLMESIVQQSSGSVFHNAADTPEVKEYMYDVLRFNRYWLDDYSFEHSADDTVLNIWKVSDSEKEPHAQRIHDYLKRRYFADKDLSALKNGIIELYYNIIDHAKAEGNAFSFIRYDKQTHKLHFAVCDFGVGIAALIRQSPQYDLPNDAVAIVKALEPGVTSGSQSHNKGMGLDNIAGMLFDDNTMNMVSNRGQVVVKGNKKAIESWENDFEFPGTLIWLDVSMDRFEPEERQNSYSLSDV